jgi:Ca-activated chloride channel family protein
MWDVRGAAGTGSVVRGIRLTSLLGLFLAGRCLLWCEQLENPASVAATLESNTLPSSEKTGDPTHIKVNSDLVVIPVTVTDGQGRVVDGLQKEHFALYEDKVEQQITHFTSEDAPVSIGLVFDTSDRMGPKLHKAREAVTALLNNANPEDEYFLVRFSDRAQLLASITTQTEKIRREVATMQTGGTTALLDGVAAALNEMKNAQHTRKAIILISDGEDNASHCSVRDLKEAVRRADVLIYAIGITDSSSYSQSWPPQGSTGSALLNEIAKETGGRLFEVNRLKQLPDIASKISTWPPDYISNCD